MTIGHIAGHIVNQFETPADPDEVGLEPLELHSETVVGREGQSDAFPGVFHRVLARLRGLLSVQVVAHQQVFIVFEKSFRDTVVT
jgi:hypothetical protein